MHRLTRGKKLPEKIARQINKTGLPRGGDLPFAALTEHDAQEASHDYYQEHAHESPKEQRELRSLGKWLFWSMGHCNRRGYLGAKSLVCSD